MSEQLPKSEHFELKKLAEGVYAALARPEGLAGCNGGIIDLGNRTAVVDTFISPAAAADLRDAALQLTGRDPDLVFITHHHSDHIWGNQAFEKHVCILSSQETFRVIEETGEESLKQNRKDMLEMIDQTQEQLKAEADAGKKAEIAANLEQYQRRLALVNSIQLRLPSLVCQGPLSFYGTLRNAEFIPYERAHSPGNSVIFLSRDGILFVGDLLFARRHPFMGDGAPQGWIRVLEKIIELNPETIVPGHGPVSTLAEIKEMRDYIQVISEKVQAFVKAGKPASALDEIELPEPYVSWQPQMLLERSLNGLYQYYSQKQN